VKRADSGVSGEKQHLGDGGLHDEHNNESVRVHISNFVNTVHSFTETVIAEAE
jgi:hypothetical protein